MGLMETWAANKQKNNNITTTDAFLFLFFPENETSTTTAVIHSNKTAFLRRRPVSTPLISTVQSAISVCFLLFFLTLLCFTLYSDPTLNSDNNSRRQLSNKSQFHGPKEITLLPYLPFNLSFHPALQGMGTLYSRGTRAMNDVILTHAVDSLTPNEFRLFLRLLFRSGILSKSDLLLIFQSKSPAFDRVVAEEIDSFLKLVVRRSDRSSRGVFDPTQFKISDKKMKESGEPIWGRRIKRNVSESTRLSYGSVVGFDSDELDPENSLAGFLDHVPMSLRRWACYPMLLGRVRRNFKYVILVDPKEILLLGDPLGRVKNRSPDSVYLTTVTQSAPTKHVNNSDRKWVNPGIVMGGARAVRRLLNAMLMEIVRTAMQRKKRNPVTELGVINQLVANEYVSKRVNLTVLSESIPRLSSLTGLNSKPGAPIVSKFAMDRPGNSNGDGSLVILKYLCSLYLDSTVYPDC